MIGWLTYQVILVSVEACPRLVLRKQISPGARKGVLHVYSSYPLNDHIKHQGVALPCLETMACFVVSLLQCLLGIELEISSGRRRFLRIGNIKISNFI